MIYTPGTHKTDDAPKMLFALSSIYSCILALTAIPAQTLSDFLCAIAYAYHNMFLLLMRGIQDVHIRAMLFSCCSRQAVVHRRKYKSHPFLNGYTAFFYCVLIKSFHKPVPSPHGLQARCAPTCGTLHL